MLSLPQVADTTQAAESPFDSTWAAGPVQTPSGLEAVMLSHDKIYVVLVVVLIIWFGLLFFLFRTDRKLTRLERTLEERITEND